MIEWDCLGVTVPKAQLKDVWMAEEFSLWLLNMNSLIQMEN